MTIEALSLEVRRLVRGERSALMLFGSHARGDAAHDSDVDVLQVVAYHRPSYKIGRFSFSVYTMRHLLRMATRGSLFLLHLLREAKIIDATIPIVQALQQAFVPQESYEFYRAELSGATQLLDATDMEYLLRWHKYESLAAYILRSALYSCAYDRGDFTFALDKVATMLGVLPLAPLIRSAGLNAPNIIRFRKLTEECERFLDTDAVNPYGSPEALIANSLPHAPLTTILGLRLLNEEARVLSYEEIELSEDVREWSA